MSLAVSGTKVVLTVEGLKATIPAQNFTWTATASSAFGITQELNSAAPVAAPVNNTADVNVDIASTLSGLMTYRVTVTFADGTRLTTNTVMG